MLEQCVDNDTVSARSKALVCAFYKTAVDYRKDPASVSSSKLVNLMMLYLVIQADGYIASNDLRKRTDILQYDPVAQTCTLKFFKVVREFKTRVQYILDRNYNLPGVLEQMSKPDTEPLTIPANVFLFTMFETFAKVIPDNLANDCQLCVSNA
jgi:hypothetical protein